jgi:hypothetical protein
MLWFFFSFRFFPLLSLQQSPHGCFDATMGEKYRRLILQPGPRQRAVFFPIWVLTLFFHVGANQDAMDMLRAFLGRGPSIEPFLASLGIV